MAKSNTLIIRHFSGLQPYVPLWEDMKQLTAERDENTLDEIWLLEHEPVFTQGQAGKAEHILNPHQIPVIQIDRGGQVTYHGPGQLVIYLMLDVKRLGLGARAIVTIIEESIVNVLAELGIKSAPRADAPGVYVTNKKIASLGIRIRSSGSYHGLALNVNMDLQPFLWINPCGYQDLAMTQIVNETKLESSIQTIGASLSRELMGKLGYTESKYETGPWRSE